MGDSVSVPNTSALATPRSVLPGGRRISTAPTAPQVRRWDLPLVWPRYNVVAYLGAFNNNARSQDALAVVEVADRLLLGVADGVTPTDRTPSVGDLDGAQYAAQKIIEGIASSPKPGRAAEVFHVLNDELFREFDQRSEIESSRDRPQAAAAVVDVSVSSTGRTLESILITRSADCDVWVKEGDVWRTATRRHMLTDGPRHSLMRWDSLHPGATYTERFEIERNAGLDDIENWNITALGRFEEVRLETVEVGGANELLIATDGARLHHWKWQDSTPDDWFRRLREWELSNLPLHRQHSDVAALWLRSAAPNA